VLRQLDTAGVAVLDVGMRRPTLDDVFLILTGQPAEQSEQSDPAQQTGAGRVPEEVAQ